MTVSGATTTLRESTQNVRIAPHAILLNAVAVITWIAIICLKAWQWDLTHSDTWGDPAPEVAALEAWVDVLFIAAISATIGLIVLGAVRHMLNQLPLATR